MCVCECERESDEQTSEWRYTLAVASTRTDVSKKKKIEILWNIYAFDCSGVGFRMACIIEETKRTILRVNVESVGRKREREMGRANNRWHSEWGVFSATPHTHTLHMAKTEAHPPARRWRHAGRMCGEAIWNSCCTPARSPQSHLPEKPHLMD